MSIEHKAFLFDIDNFNLELRPIIERALVTGKHETIRDFIIFNQKHLVDPYEGEQLGDNWEEMIEDSDLHQYGDFALTKYYSPTADAGLGYSWEYIKTIFDTSHQLDYSPLLGTLLEVDGVFFDPGKLGSYFQTCAEVKNNLCLIRAIENIINEENTDAFNKFKNLLEGALVRKKGLYITF